MTIGRRTLRYLPAAAVLFLGISATAQPSPNSGQSLEGAWQVSITLPEGLPAPPCAPAGTLATHDGLVLAESCWGFAGAAYGVWARTAHGQFAITMTGNSYGGDGAVAGTYKVRAKVTLAPDGRSFSGEYHTDTFDVAGKQLGSFTGRIRAVCIQLELLN
ncbi:MAG: hypothetical protein LAQ69_45005 [Acidobacteriia bacterium]|nr:hypothetical protein [Terriglobia bacterium]